MYNENADASPFNVLPPVVIALAAILAGVEIIFQAGESGLVGGAGAVGWRLGALEDYAFFGPIWAQMLEKSYFPLEHMQRFVTYPFVHGSFTHAAFAVVIVLAIGKAVGEVFSAVSFIAVFMVSSIVAALVYALLTDTQQPLFGAYPGAYGLIGAFTFLLWVNLAAVGANSMRAFSLIGFLMLFQLVFGLLFGGGYDWVADVAGFVAGFLLSFVVSPGGWGRVLAKLRKR
ncbi:rhomboid family intramembrane serine protease [Litoreibacter arenae]|uniref:Rhomboid family protein n=1 Tax=Litoreibacter arenae DSM 19593 TaxID=1123360 RepID=S9S5S6_9RHOB|nr:rhomboid family intramembrane serine protease [Litoreibacter arenae]EPX81549.1 Rhomboid family protein [Litoreibacter arenae DSM 19593]